MKIALTPVQRFLQAEPSWFRSGQTTTLFSSDTEKDPVRDARGGIPSCIYPHGPCEEGRTKGSDRQGGGASRIGSSAAMRQLWGALAAQEAMATLVGYDDS